MISYIRHNNTAVLQYEHVDVAADDTPDEKYYYTRYSYMAESPYALVCAFSEHFSCGMIFYTYCNNTTVPRCVKVNESSMYFWAWMTYYTYHNNIYALHYAGLYVPSNGEVTWMTYYTHYSYTGVLHCVCPDADWNHFVYWTIYYTRHMNINVLHNEDNVSLDDLVWWMTYYRHNIDMDAQLYVYVYDTSKHSFA
jgi:hypothetical protein